MSEYLRPVPDWDEHEKPALPGTASYPWHPPHRHAAYAAIAVLVALTGGLGNALVSANLPQIQGQLGLSPAEGNWLLAAYLMANVSANLLLFKFRQQYGMRLFAELGLGIYAALAVLHLFVGSPATTLAVRAASGFAGAACTTLGTLYMLQAMPRRYVARMLIIGVGLAQLAVPVAWLISPTLMDLGQWHNLYLFEAGMALCSFAAVVVLKLPPGIQTRVLECKDFLTFALLAPALAILVAVLCQGYVRCWLDTPWLGWGLCVALVLGCAAFLVEHHRERPLLQIRWIFSPTMLQFMLGAFVLRLLTNEQSYGMVGLMRTLGMGPEQMAPLFAVILAGVVIGIAASALTFGPKSLIPQLAASVLLIGTAALLDQHRTSLDRPMDFALSQFLGAVGAGMFMGPLMLIGFRHTLARGTDHVVSFIVLLSLTQTFGGLAGSAALGSYQLHREHVHSVQLTAQLQRGDAAVEQRLRQLQPLLAAQTTDPLQRQSLATSQLAQGARREANVRAYNDVFAFSGWIALGYLLGSVALTWTWRRLRPLFLRPATSAGPVPEVERR